MELFLLNIVRRSGGTLLLLLDSGPAERSKSWLGYSCISGHDMPHTPADLVGIGLSKDYEN